MIRWSEGVALGYSWPSDYTAEERSAAFGLTRGQLKRWRNPRGAATRMKSESSSCQRNTAPQPPLLKGNQHVPCLVCRLMTDAFTHRRPCAYLCRWARAIGVTLIIRVVLYQCIESCLLYGLQSLSLYGHTPGLKHPRVVHILQCCKVTMCRCSSPYLSEVEGHLYLICIFLYLSCLLLVPSALFLFFFFPIELFSYRLFQRDNDPGAHQVCE